MMEKKKHLSDENHLEDCRKFIKLFKYIATSPDRLDPDSMRRVLRSWACKRNPEKLATLLKNAIKDPDAYLTAYGMVVCALLNDEDFSPEIREATLSVLLISLDPPKNKRGRPPSELKTKIAIGECIMAAEEVGYCPPTSDDKCKPSICHVVADAFDMKYKNIQKIRDWYRRCPHLSKDELDYFVDFYKHAIGKTENSK